VIFHSYVKLPEGIFFFPESCPRNAWRGPRRCRPPGTGLGVPRPPKTGVPPPNFFPNPVAYYGLLWLIMVVTMVYSGLFSYSWSCSLTGEKNWGDILVKSHVHRRFPWRWSKWNSPFGPPFNHSTCTSNSSQMRVAALMVASWLGWTPFWLCKKAGMKWAWIPSQGFA
jgi:hypothetical protein